MHVYIYTYICTYASVHLHILTYIHVYMYKHIQHRSTNIYLYTYIPKSKCI